MTTNIEKSAFVLIQLGQTTFGNGDTAEAAREDSREWLDSPDDADGVDVCMTVGAVSRHADGDLVIVPRDVADDLGSY